MRRYSDLTVEEKLKFLENALNAAGDLILVKNRASRIVWGNKALCEFACSPFDELTASGNIEDVETSDLNRWVTDDARVFRSGEKLRLPAELSTSPSGADRLLQTFKDPIPNEKGEADFLVVVSREVLDAEALEKARNARSKYADASSQLNLLVKQLPTPIALVDFQMRYLAKSEQWDEEILRAQVGSGSFDVIQAKESALRDAFVQSIQGQTIELKHIEIVRPDGSHDIVDLDIRPWISGEGRPIEGVWIAARIVSEEVRTKAALVEASTTAAEALKVKTQFLSNVSHEIRTPINGIVGATQLLRSRCKGSEEREIIAFLEESNRQLTDLVDSILSFSDAENRRPEQNVRKFRFEDFASSLRGRFSERFASKKLDFSVDIGAGLEPMVEGDDEILMQAVAALVDNALKFTNTGSAKVEITRDRGTSVQIVVADTGVGISRADRSKLFNVFEQADGGDTRKFGGLGIGLALVRNCVAILGGRLQLQSEPGQGTRVSIVLPIRFVETHASRLSVALVAKNPFLAKLSRASLERAGAWVLSTENVEELQEELLSKSFDFIVYEEGFEAEVERVRARTEGLRWIVLSKSAATDLSASTPIAPNPIPARMAIELFSRQNLRDGVVLERRASNK